MIDQRPDAILGRIVNIKDILKEKLIIETDKEEIDFLQSDLKEIDDFLKVMERYVQSVFIDEEKNKNLARFKDDCNDIKEYQYKFESLEKDRKSKHNLLILKTKLVDKICENYGAEPIYGELGEFKNDSSKLIGSENYNNPGVREARHKLANWSFDFMIACSAALVVESDVLKNYNKNEDSFNVLSNVICKMNIKKNIDGIIEVIEEKHHEIEKTHTR